MIYTEAAYAALREAWQVLGDSLRTVIEQERADSPALQGVEQENMPAPARSQRTDHPLQTI